jgi:hypothetical protein
MTSGHKQVEGFRDGHAAELIFFFLYIDTACAKIFMSREHKSLLHGAEQMSGAAPKRQPRVCGDFLCFILESRECMLAGSSVVAAWYYCLCPVCRLSAIVEHFEPTMASQALPLAYRW